jgi:hypothetical protein
MRKIKRMRKQNKEKYTLWMDRQDLAALRNYQESMGVPVSESVRRAIAEYIQRLKKKL